MKIWSPFFVSKKTKNNKSVWYAHFPDPDDSQKRKVRSVEILRSQLGSADTSPIRRKVEAIKYYSLIIDSSFSVKSGMLVYFPLVHSSLRLPPPGYQYPS